MNALAPHTTLPTLMRMVTATQHRNRVPARKMIAMTTMQQYFRERQSYVMDWIMIVMEP